MAGGRRAPTFDLAVEARMAANAFRRTRWMFDDPATLAIAALSHHPNRHKITKPEVHELVNAIAIDPSKTRNRTDVDIGGEKAYCTAREIRIASATLYYSPRMPGLFERDAIPDEPGIAAKALDMVRNELKARRYKGPPIIDARDARKRPYGFSDVLFRLPRPEADGGEEYEEKGSFEHSPDAEMQAAARKVAASIDLRWRNRHDIYGRIAGANRWAQEIIVGADGMTYEGVPTPSYISYDNDGQIQRISVMCSFSIIGDMLKHVVRNASAHSEDQFKKLLASHRRNKRKLEQAPSSEGSVDGVLTVDHILAAAIRGQMHTYGEGMLAEIEALLQGQRIRPTNPVRRGISIFNVRNGELTGPVKLGKGVGYQNGRVNAKGIKSLPDTIMATLPGRPMDDVIGHPYLKGVTIRSASINGEILSLRPEPSPEPLYPLLDELRSAVADKA